jgi:hypothetical protein
MRKSASRAPSFVPGVTLLPRPLRQLHLRFLLLLVQLLQLHRHLRPL